MPYYTAFNSLFFFNDTATTEIYTLSLHDALPISLAGLLWSKQYYNFDATRWLEEHGVELFEPSRSTARNAEWTHMVNAHVISMPDKWEYPWYAAWDLAFHAVALASVDVDFAKAQLDLMLREVYMHPSGQIPAYEWN